MKQSNLLLQKFYALLEWLTIDMIGDLLSLLWFGFPIKVSGQVSGRLVNSDSKVLSNQKNHIILYLTPEVFLDVSITP